MIELKSCMMSSDLLIQTVDKLKEKHKKSQHEVPVLPFQPYPYILLEEVPSFVLEIKE